MKQNIYQLVSIVLLFLLSGCEDFLNLYPKDTLNPTSYFSSEKELALYTNQFYEQMPSAASGYDQCADDFIRSTLGDALLGQRSPAQENGWNWSMLRHINYYLENSSNCDNINARNHYDGVAYFMRAYFYYVKVRRYGDVPWYDKVIGSDDKEALFKARDDRQIVMKHVIEDLDKAIELLPTAHSLYEVTKWSALALKSQAALFEGTFRKYHGLDNYEYFLTESANAGRDFIQHSGYMLYKSGSEPYRDLFACDIAKSEEVILARCYTEAQALLHTVQYHANISSDKCSFTRRFINHYLMDDGTPFTGKPDYKTISYLEETRNRDPRLSQTILCPGYIQKGNSKVTANTLFSHTGYQFIKYVMETSYDAYNKSPNDWPIFRSAEVYLNYSEALAELGTITQDDLDISLNLLRDRVGMPHLVLANSNAKPDPYMLECYPNVAKGQNTGVILEIRRERTIEMCLEGRRYWDMIRWKEGKQFLKPLYGIYFPGEGYYDTTGDGKINLILYTDTYKKVLGAVARKIGEEVILSEGTSGYVVGLPTVSLRWNEERDYLYPIPKDERTLSGGVLTQNPGWDD